MSCPARTLSLPPSNIKKGEEDVEITNGIKHTRKSFVRAIELSIQVLDKN
jgi:hypothetical protein